MLLRIVAAAGTGILLGASACSSSSAQFHGIAVNPTPDDPGDAAIEFASDAVPPDEGAPDEGAPMVGSAIGLMTCDELCLQALADAGVSDAVADSPADASTDASLPCGHGGVCGSVFMPPDAGPDAGDDAASDAGVFHGIVHGVVINPGH